MQVVLLHQPRAVTPSFVLLLPAALVPQRSQGHVYALLRVPLQVAGQTLLVVMTACAVVCAVSSPQQIRCHENGCRDALLVRAGRTSTSPGMQTWSTRSGGVSPALMPSTAPSAPPTTSLAASMAPTRSCTATNAMTTTAGTGLSSCYLTIIHWHLSIMHSMPS